MLHRLLMCVQKQVSFDPSPPHPPEVRTCVRKNISVVDFTLLAADESVVESLMCLLCVCSVFQLMYVRLYVCAYLYLYVFEHQRTLGQGFGINKQELAFICHSRINLLPDGSREQRAHR